MRTRIVIEICVIRVDDLDSELRLVTDDGTCHAFRTLQSRHATIEHAAQRLAEHYGLEPGGPLRWVARRRHDGTRTTAAA